VRLGAVQHYVADAAAAVADERVVVVDDARVVGDLGGRRRERRRRLSAEKPTKGRDERAMARYDGDHRTSKTTL
jgi:hypothetical protein